MASEIRVDKITHTAGVGTITPSPTGVHIAGIVTGTTFSGSGASLTNLPAGNLSGTLPAISATNLTNVPAANITGTLPAISAANLTNIPAANVTGTLPALTAANLTNIPAANIVGVATAGFGNASGAFSQGITEADQWRLTTALTTNDSSIIYNLERNDNTFDKIGTGMSTNAGDWTFPSTGIWLIIFNFDGYNSAENRYIGGYIDGSNNSGSSYSTLVEAYSSTSNDTNAYATGNMSAIYDVTDTSTQRVRFRVTSEYNFNFNGSSNINRTYFTFLRLGDT